MTFRKLVNEAMRGLAEDFAQVLERRLNALIADELAVPEAKPKQTRARAKTRATRVAPKAAPKRARAKKKTKR